MPTVRKRKIAQTNEPAPKKVRTSSRAKQAAQPVPSSASSSELEEGFSEVAGIVAYNAQRRKYQIRWCGRDPSTGEPWPDDWLPKKDITDDTLAEWSEWKDRYPNLKRRADSDFALVSSGWQLKESQSSRALSSSQTVSDIQDSPSQRISQTATTITAGARKSATTAPSKRGLVTSPPSRPSRTSHASRAFRSSPFNHQAEQASPSASLTKTPVSACPPQTVNSSTRIIPDSQTTGSANASHTLENLPPSSAISHVTSATREVPGSASVASSIRRLRSSRASPTSVDSRPTSLAPQKYTSAPSTHNRTSELLHSTNPTIDTPDSPKSCSDEASPSHSNQSQDPAHYVILEIPVDSQASYQPSPPQHHSTAEDGDQNTQDTPSASGGRETGPILLSETFPDTAVTVHVQNSSSILQQEVVNSSLASCGPPFVSLNSDMANHPDSSPAHAEDMQEGQQTGPLSTEASSNDDGVSTKPLKIPIELMNQQRSPYVATIGRHANLMKQFLSLDELSNEAQDIAQTLGSVFSSLQEIEDHADLLRSEDYESRLDAQSDAEITSSNSMQWDRHVSSKIVFLDSVIDELTGGNKTLAVFYQPGRFVDILEKFLTMKAVKWTRTSPPFKTQVFDHTGFQVLLINAYLPAPGNFADSIDLAISLASDFGDDTDAPDFGIARSLTARGRLVTPIPMFSMTHACLCLGKSSPANMDLRELVKYTLALAELDEQRVARCGKPYPGIPVAKEVGRVIGRAIANNEPIPTLREAGDFDDFAENMNIAYMQQSQSSSTQDAAASVATSSTQRVQGTYIDNFTASQIERERDNQKAHEEALGALQGRFEVLCKEKATLELSLKAANDAVLAAEARLAKTHAIVETSKQEMIQMRAEVETSRRNLKESGISDLQELTLLRERSKRVDVLEKQLAGQKQTNEYTTQQYQNASSSAVELAETNRLLEAENKQLQKRASDQAVELRKLFESSSIKAAIDEVKKKDATLQQQTMLMDRMYKQMRKLETQVKDFAQREETRNGMAAATRAGSRAGSAAPSPLAARIAVHDASRTILRPSSRVSSRQASPAATGLSQPHSSVPMQPSHLRYEP